MFELPRVEDESQKLKLKKGLQNSQKAGPETRKETVKFHY
jgi:hypothetical protein